MDLERDVFAARRVCKGEQHAEVFIMGTWQIDLVAIGKILTCHDGTILRPALGDYNGRTKWFGRNERTCKFVLENYF